MKKLTLLCIIGLMLIRVDAQMLFPEVFSTFGGHVENEHFQLTYTCGEPLFETLSNQQDILTQGFNQTVFVTTDVEEILLMPDFNVSVYPNPTRSIVYISVQTERLGVLQVEIYDMQGRIQMQFLQVSELERIDIEHLPSGIYLLRITTPQLSTKTFKIIKVK